MLDSTPAKPIDGTILPYFEGYILQQALQTQAIPAGGHTAPSADHVMGTHIWERKLYLDFKPVAKTIGCRSKQLPLSMREYSENVRFVAVPVKGRRGRYEVTLKIVSTLSPESGRHFPDGKTQHVSRVAQKSPSGKKVFSYQEALGFLQQAETEKGLVEFPLYNQKKNEFMHWSRVMFVRDNQSKAKQKVTSEMAVGVVQKPKRHRRRRKHRKTTLDS